MKQTRYVARLVQPQSLTLSRQFAYKEMRGKLSHNERLMDKMIPKNFNVACRRPTPGNGYLEALIGDKTTVFTEDINTITPKGFTTQDGTEHEVDVIICATGFDTSFRPRFPIVGLNGISLADQWKTLPASYISLAAPNFPNYFMFSGPFTPVAQVRHFPTLSLPLSGVSDSLLRVPSSLS